MSDKQGLETGCNGITESAAQHRSSRVSLSPTEDTLDHLTAVSNMYILVLRKRLCPQWSEDARVPHLTDYCYPFCWRSGYPDTNSSSRFYKGSMIRDVISKLNGLVARIGKSDNTDS